MHKTDRKYLINENLNEFISKKKTSLLYFPPDYNLEFTEYKFIVTQLLRSQSALKTTPKLTKFLLGSNSIGGSRFVAYYFHSSPLFAQYANLYFIGDSIENLSFYNVPLDSELRNHFNHYHKFKVINILGKPLKNQMWRHEYSLTDFMENGLRLRHES